MRKNNIIIDQYDAPIRSNEKGVTLEDASRYLYNWKVWEETFSKETINWILANVSIGDICAIHYVPKEDAANSYYDKDHERECVDDFHHFEEYKGNTDFHRTVYLPAIGYRVSYRYQSVTLGKIYKEALIREFPYLKDYKFEAYTPSYSSDFNEIYIKLTYKDENGEDVTASLYTPVKALVEKNAMLIYKRHWDYNGNYYASDPAYKKKILGVLKSREFHELREKVDGKFYSYTGELL